MKVLIADDDAQIRRLIRIQLEAHPGWIVCAEAENGHAAVQGVRSSQPDFIILDLAMPRMNGLNAAREISQEFPGIPILLHTLYNSPILELEARKCGVQHVLPKSAGWAIVDTIERMLNPPKAAETAKAANRAGVKHE